MVYGLDTRIPFRLAHVSTQVFEIFPSLEALPLSVRQLVIALPDSQILGDKVSLKKIESLLARFNIIAVEPESIAIKRALQFENKAQESCFAIFHHDSERSFLCVFLHQEKIFFHEEKVADKEIAKKRFSKLFEKDYPSCVIEHYYEDTDWLLSTGLSLWNEKTCQNLLPLSFTPRLEGKSMVKLFLKAGFYGLATVFLIYALLLILLHFQDEKISLFEDALPQITQAETVNQKMIELDATLKMLESISEARPLPLHFLEALNAVMPEGVFLDTLTLKQNRVTMAGRSETQAQAETLLKNISANKNFHHAKFETLTQNDSTPPYHFSFEISLDIQ